MYTDEPGTPLVLHRQGTSAWRVLRHESHCILLVEAPEDEQEYGLTVVTGIKLLLGTELGMDKKETLQWRILCYLDRVVADFWQRR